MLLTSGHEMAVYLQAFIPAERKAEKKVTSAYTRKAKSLPQVLSELLLISHRGNWELRDCTLSPVSRWEDPDMVSLCVRLWKPCKDTWGTESLLTAPRKQCSSHEAPSAFCRPELYFQPGGDWTWDYGRRLISPLPPPPTHHRGNLVPQG